MRLGMSKVEGSKLRTSGVRASCVKVQQRSAFGGLRRSTCRSLRAHGPGLSLCGVTVDFHGHGHDLDGDDDDDDDDHADYHDDDRYY